MPTYEKLRPHRHLTTTLTLLSFLCFKLVCNKTSFSVYVDVPGTKDQGEEANTGTTSYRIVPARSGLKAYNQSFMSLSLRACKRTPRCFVHTAKVFGV